MLIRWTPITVILACIIGASWFFRVEAGNDFPCEMHTTCADCLNIGGYGGANSGECQWCLGGTFDGQCKFSCGTDVHRRIEKTWFCPEIPCSDMPKCEECLDHRTTYTDCQWCIGTSQCADFYGERQGCDDVRALRVIVGDDRDHCPRRDDELRAEMAFGLMGLICTMAFIPCFFCRCCMLPPVWCHDKCLWCWKRKLIKGYVQFEEKQQKRKGKFFKRTLDVGDAPSGNGEGAANPFSQKN